MIVLVAGELSGDRQITVVKTLSQLSVHALSKRPNMAKEAVINMEPAKNVMSKYYIKIITVFYTNHKLMHLSSYLHFNRVVIHINATDV